jgi:hypothetical protein
MKKFSLWWRLFIVVQSTGLICLFASSVSGTGRLTMVLWGTSFVLLLPGNNWPAGVIEKALWTGPLSAHILPIELIAAVLANAVVWYVLGSIGRLIWRTVRPNPAFKRDALKRAP